MTDKIYVCVQYVCMLPAATATSCAHLIAMEAVIPFSAMLKSIFTQTILLLTPGELNKCHTISPLQPLAMPTTFIPALNHEANRLAHTVVRASVKTKYQPCFL